MADIKTRDVQSFGKVLKRLGQFLEQHPEKLLDLLTPSEEERGKIKHAPRDTALEDERRYPELDNFPIFELAKSKSREELLALLGRHDVDQLRYLIRRFRFGALKSKSPQVLAEHIADQATKRTVDVFSSHE